MKKAETVEARDLKELERRWEAIAEAGHGSSRREFDELVARWGDQKEQDPICIPVDLLSPLGRERSETSHTRFLAWLLDPQATHGLGTLPLELFLDWADLMLEAAKELPIPIPRRAPELLTASVSTERGDRVLSTEGIEGRLRTDLWIEIPSAKPEVMIVVEAKIDALLVQDQLALYEQAIEARLKVLRARGCTPRVVRLLLLPFLTDGDYGKWVQGTLFQLGLDLHPLLKVAAPGTQLMRLYLATVFQKVIGIVFDRQATAVSRGLLIEYLRAVVDR